MLKHLLLAVVAALIVDRFGGDRSSRSGKLPGLPDARPWLRLTIGLGVGLFLLSITVTQCSRTDAAELATFVSAAAQAAGL